MRLKPSIGVQPIVLIRYICGRHGPFMKVPKEIYKRHDIYLIKPCYWINQIHMFVMPLDCLKRNLGIVMYVMPNVGFVINCVQPSFCRYCSCHLIFISSHWFHTHTLSLSLSSYIYMFITTHITTIQLAQELWERPLSDRPTAALVCSLGELFISQLVLMNV